MPPIWEQKWSRSCFLPQRSFLLSEPIIFSVACDPWHWISLLQQVFRCSSASPWKLIFASFVHVCSLFPCCNRRHFPLLFLFSGIIYFRPASILYLLSELRDLCLISFVFIFILLFVHTHTRPASWSRKSCCRIKNADQVWVESAGAEWQKK